MDGFVWKPGFEIGLEKIDDEHKLLLRHLNDCVASPAGSEGIFAELKDYAEFHFTREEGLMAASAYPEYEPHRRAHRLFEERVLQLEEAVAGRNHASVTLLTSFLRNWFLEHILQDDQAFASYLRGTLSQTEIDALLQQDV